MPSGLAQDEERVIVVAPTARDARLSQALFTQAGIPCAICQDLVTFGPELARGVGAVVLTEEALAPQHRELLTAALAAQPTWSSLPIILLASSDPRQLLAAPLVQQLGNVTILERPISTQTLLSVVQMALRARRRQYQARLVAEASRLLTAFLGDDTTLSAVTALLVPHLADCCLLYIIDGTTPYAAALAFSPEAGLAEARLRDTLARPVPGPPVGKATAAGHDIPQTSAEWVAVPSALALAERHLEIVGAAASLVVPLELQRRSLGALGLGKLTPGRAFSEDDRQVVQEVAGRLALALDQARLYYAEQAARAEAEAAVRSRDDLLALISHDLNNPLTAVLGQAQLLERQLPGDSLTPERLQRGIAAIGRAARQMQAQIAELLDMAKLQAGQPIELRYELTDLITLTRTVVGAVQQGSERHAITLRTDLPALMVQVDPMRMARVLDNLLSNAIKYSPDGGTITVRLAVEGEGAEVCAVLQVRDQGIGIPATELRHVFERFWRASNVTSALPGTGLGLSSVRQIVEQHGGMVTVESPQDGGAVFTVCLPLDRPGGATR